ncbi:hypothetical protein EMPG_16229 [Blastomyces silverae]|uniref:Uncharacterized protein n=1 Tax=Blastomyces silverae TaxID=2060906 RepID=A0A0H1BB74_9EURO|nr:hypothetical protein EMPG_16229 [Blastomyces silverae]
MLLTNTASARHTMDQRFQDEKPCLQQQDERLDLHVAIAGEAPPKKQSPHRGEWAILAFVSAVEKGKLPPHEAMMLTTASDCYPTLPLADGREIKGQPPPTLLNAGRDQDARDLRPPDPILSIRLSNRNPQTVLPDQPGTILPSCALKSVWVHWKALVNY